MSEIRLIDANALLNRVDEEREYLKARGQLGAEHILVHNFRDLIDNAPTVDLRLMKVEECAGHTLDYAMGWKACIEWLKQGGDTQYFDKENKE